MKITMVTGVWKRPEVFKMFAKGVRYLNNEIDGLNLEVIVAGSEGEKSRKMVEDEGFTYIEIANQPLAAKMNATTLKAKESNPDYVICMGSDDVLHPSAMVHYLEWMNKGYDFIGCQDFYFYDMQSGKSLYWGGYMERYRRMHTAGAGRCISRKLMERWNWQPWTVGDDAMLDNSMQGKIRGKQRVLNLKRLNAYALDIKSVENMTPFERWGNTKFINSEIILDKFDYLFK